MIAGADSTSSRRAASITCSTGGSSMKLRSMLGVGAVAAALVISSALLLPGPTARADDEASATQTQDRHVDFASLPFSHAIKTVHGNGSRKLAVFADPYCPYCRTLEHRLSELSNVTIYTFLFRSSQPIRSRWQLQSGVHPTARRLGVAGCWTGALRHEVTRALAHRSTAISS
ncbi:thiol:disulfide interchange protein DsbC [Caballeronia arationis]|nr:thiol:disulfide interchange protein DsbC [Caballeronia arationis]